MHKGFSRQHKVGWSDQTVSNMHGKFGPSAPQGDAHLVPNDWGRALGPSLPYMLDTEKQTDLMIWDEK